MLSFALLAFFLPLLNAREQQLFSLDSKVQTFVPEHHRPWSLLLSQNIESSTCVILSSPEHTQSHKSIRNPGDVVVINKSSSSVDGVEGVIENTLEIVGFDRRVLWSKAGELCTSIEDQSFTAVDTTEYEVVLPWN